MPNKIAFVGEAWGREEEEQGKPFVGASGRFLRALASQQGIDLRQCLVTNCFNLRPPGGNDIVNLCGNKAEGIPGSPPLFKGKYIRAEYAGELDRLRDELAGYGPDIVVALGATPTWALLGTQGGIKSHRGAVAWSDAYGVKVLPTYHPAAVLREYKLHPILLADLDKARRESAFPEIRRPPRDIWIDPSLDDIVQFANENIAPNPRLSVDIETKNNSITCIGFAPTDSVALVVPFWDYTKPDGNYWRTLDEELAAWHLVRKILEMGKDMVFQNGMYDMSFSWLTMGLKMPSSEDTMLLHHSLQPEMEKGLGFLATIYTDEASWKGMRTAHVSESKQES